MFDFTYCEKIVNQFETVIKQPTKNPTGKYYTGVDLGTAYVVMAVLDEHGQPVAGAYRAATVVKDGMVVDYIGAIQIVKELKAEIEAALGVELLYAAGAIPPNTENLGGSAVRNVIEAAGFEVVNMLDEPTAANKLLQIENGAVVDIGGGTTGVAIFKNGDCVHVDDQATGGTHFSLVLAGAYKIPFEEADAIKRDYAKHKEIFPVVKAVVEKIATIVSSAVADYQVEQLFLVGGSSCLTGIEDIIAKTTGIETLKPANPFFVTPLGIALSAKEAAID